jgi:hypothetical protein
VDVLALIAQARAAGLELRVEGDRLLVNGPRSAAPIVTQLRDHKMAVLALLDGDAPAPAPRPPHCTDLAHEDAGWWHVAPSGAWFCTSWQCQPENQQGSIPPPVPAGTLCGDPAHEPHWHVLTGGTWVCRHTEHDAPPDNGPAA